MSCAVAAGTAGTTASAGSDYVINTTAAGKTRFQRNVFLGSAGLLLLLLLLLLAAAAVTNIEDTTFSKKR